LQYPMTGITGDSPSQIGVRVGRLPLVDFVVATIVIAALAWGWRDRAEPALDPHNWPGYLFGLAGALMMLIVVGFSWRKRVATGRVSVATLYNGHVLLGLFGPVLVVIHARFAWGSINSTFALAATLSVVFSGLVARYALGPARRSGNPWAIAVAEAWHYLHLPLYVVLVMAVILHVYMAHAY